MNKNESEVLLGKSGSFFFEPHINKMRQRAKSRKEKKEYENSSEAGYQADNLRGTSGYAKADSF